MISVHSEKHFILTWYECGCSAYGIILKIVKASQLQCAQNNGKRISEAYLESCQTLKMEHFVKIISGFQPLNIAKRSILYVWQGSEYASGYIDTISKEKWKITLYHLES